MTHIGLISDTHGYLDDNVFHHFKNCDEIWHCGDFGNMSLINQLKEFKPLRGVYGNIDDSEIQHLFPEQNIFVCEGINVYMQHIGGYPKRYAPGVKKKIGEVKAKLFISGHSHILKVIYDQNLNCLHMNPGAAGRAGWHTVRTLLKFDIHGSEILNCNIIELGPRSM